MRSIKDVELLSKSRPWRRGRNVYKRQAGQNQKIYYFLSVFVFLCFSPHFFLVFFLEITNKPQQATIPSSLFSKIQVVWLFFTIASQHQLIFSEQMLIIFKKAFSDRLASKWFPYTQIYLFYIQNGCHFGIVHMLVSR